MTEDGRRATGSSGSPDAPPCRPVNPNRPMPTRELAERLGISVDTFYRTRGDYHREGLPPPITARRPFKWHRQSAEAWLGRHHPLAPKLSPPANDTVVIVPIAERDDDAQRAFLHRAYAPPA